MRFILLLIQPVESADAYFRVGACTGQVYANHTVFFSTEGTDPSLVDRDRNCQNREAYVDATSHGGNAAGEPAARFSTPIGLPLLARIESIRQAEVDVGTQAAPNAPPRSTRLGEKPAVE